MHGLFKQCPFCKKEWISEDEFLQDRTLLINGYQFAGKLTTSPFPDGYLLFTHSVQGCGTTLAVKAKTFKEGKQNKQKQHLLSLT
jgi:hypothetical protein